MSEQNPKGSGNILPLPAFIFRPLTAVIIAIIHVYLASGHMYDLFTGNLQWTDIWKGFGALLGAYVFSALAVNGYFKDRKKTREQLYSTH